MHNVNNHICVLLWIIELGRYWGIVTVPGLPQSWTKSTVPIKKSTHPRNGSQTYHLALSPLREPGVAASSHFILTTSLVTPIPSSSSSKKSTTNAVDNQGQRPSGSVSGQIQSLFGLIGEGHKWWSDLLSTGVPRVCKILLHSWPKQSNTCFCVKKKQERPEGEVPAPNRSRTHRGTDHLFPLPYRNKACDMASFICWTWPFNMCAMTFPWVHGGMTHALTRRHCTRLSSVWATTASGETV